MRKKKPPITNGVDYDTRREHTFAIPGNHDDDTANPIPYQRLTQRTKKYAKGIKYAMWKAYVAKHYVDSLDSNSEAETNIAVLGKPIALEQHETAVVHCEISFKGHNHGDPDNVLKGVVDALFTDDKHVDGSTRSTFGGEQGVVIVTITIYSYDRCK